MVKPVYLHDLITDQFIEIPYNSLITIGRSKERDFTTAESAKYISRLQAEIKFLADKRILLIQRSENCDTFYGPSEDQLEQLYKDQAGILLPDYVIRFGNDYNLELLAQNDEKVQKRIVARNEDTKLIEIPTKIR